MSYQVIARKYRPQRFSDVVGQDHVTQTLANAIRKSRIAHAYLFCGPRGTGKTTLARIFAKCLNCTGGRMAVFRTTTQGGRQMARAGRRSWMKLTGGGTGEARAFARHGTR